MIIFYFKGIMIMGGINMTYCSMDMHNIVQNEFDDTQWIKNIPSDLNR